MPGMGIKLLPLAFLDGRWGVHASRSLGNGGEGRWGQPVANGKAVADAGLEDDSTIT
jgi:hypothetical protein